MVLIVLGLIGERRIVVVVVVVDDERKRFASIYDST
jgi:hypothetical protein